MRGRLTRAGLAAALALMLGSASAWAQDWPRSGWPSPLPAHPVSFPPYELKTLRNGLPVLIVLHHEQPSVSFRLIVRAGAVQEPADKPGVASLVASLVNQGTTTKSAGEIASLIESAGGAFGVGSGNELSYVNGAVIKDQMDLMLGLASDMVQHPAFSPDEIDRQRRQIVSALEVSYDDPDYLATLVFNRLVFGAHPYGRPNEGSPASIARLTRNDLVAFHRTWFVPNNALLAIVGDLTVDEALAAADRAFGGWARQDVPEVRAPDPPASARRIVVIDRPGSAQTEIRVGSLAVARTHPDYLTLDLAIRILGGEGANRLFGVLRTDRGLTYGASADMNAYRSAGDIIAETNTRSAATGDVVRLMLDEFARLEREPVDPRELRGAQDFVSGNFPLSIEAPGAIAQQVLAELFYGLDPREIETYRDRVDRVTVADIQRVAKAFLQPQVLTVVLVGDAATFVDQLKAVGFADFERIPIAQLDLSSPTLKRGAPAARDAPRKDPPPR
jgi:zinc protease